MACSPVCRVFQMNELTKVLLMGLLVFVAVVADFINGLSDEEALWRIAGRAYDVVRDDTMLREAAAGGGTEPIGPAFNQLRTAYPTRREFAAHTVNLAHGTDSLLKKLQSLGFAVVLREDQTDR